jgi:hypothetical protein
MRPLPLWLRLAVYAGFGALWLTGAAIFLLKHFLQASTEFGTAPNPWQPTALAIHGLIAVPILYLLGWMSARHVGEAWRRGGNRPSGVTLLALSAALALSGFASYYLVQEFARSANGWLHSLLGLAVIVPALVHWIAGSRRRRGTS